MSSPAELRPGLATVPTGIFCGLSEREVSEEIASTEAALARGVGVQQRATRRELERRLTELREAARWFEPLPAEGRYCRLSWNDERQTALTLFSDHSCGREETVNGVRRVTEISFAEFLDHWAKNNGWEHDGSPEAGDLQGLLAHAAAHVRLFERLSRWLSSEEATMTDGMTRQIQRLLPNFMSTTEAGGRA